MFISDPIGVNPNSIANIRKVLEHIEEISDIKQGNYKQIIVIYNRILYSYIQKIKKDFLQLILVLNTFHEEINMLKAFVELNWDINIRDAG